MKTTWRVTKVTETEGAVTADLERVAWFKSNSAYDGVDDTEEFIDAEPGEVGADYIDAAGKIVGFDISDGPELHAGDDVFVEITVAVSVDA